MQKITRFKDTVSAVGVEQSFETFAELSESLFSHPKITAKKNSHELISFCVFREQHRGNHNALAISALCFDFDDASTDAIEKIQQQLSGYEFTIHTTFSHTPAKPRFRVFLPLTEPLPAINYKNLSVLVSSRILNIEGLDKGSSEVARAYWLPSCPAESEKDFLFIYRPGAKIVASEWLKNVQTMENISSTNGQHGGRNNALKSQVAACYFAGKTLEQAAAEVLQFDADRHNPPLFTDVGEGYIATDAYAGALKFCSSIWFSLAKTNPAVTVTESQNKNYNFETQVKALTFPINLCLPPGPVGELAQAITETSIIEQPVLSLASALSIMSIAKARKVQTESGLRTNLLLLMLADSGAGKGHPLKAPKEICYGLNNDKLVGGKPASAAGLLKSVSDAECRRLIIWDEFGSYMQHLTSRQASGFYAQILACIMELFSCADSVFLGTEYANSDGKRARVDIQAPHLSILAASTPDAFYRALTGSDARSGYLPRWLVFEAPRQRGELKTTVAKNLFEAIDAGLKKYLTDIFATQMPVNLMHSTPKVIQYTPEAEQLRNDARQWFHEKTFDSISSEDGFSALWARGAEHAEKLALTICSGGKIEKAELTWALNVSRNCVEGLALALKHRIGENETERQAKRLLRVIAESGASGISGGELARRSQWITRNQRSDILRSLIDAGSVAESRSATGPGRPSLTYRASI